MGTEFLAEVFLSCMHLLNTCKRCSKRLSFPRAIYQSIEAAERALSMGDLVKVLFSKTDR